MLRYLFGALLLIALTAPSLASEFSHRNVVELTEGNFSDKVNDGGVWFVKFYAPWCGHCKRLAPTWGDLGKAFADQGKVNVAHVDCTAHKEVCNKFEVKGYPTLKVILSGSEFRTFKGPRDLEGLTAFLKEAAKDATIETVA